MQELHARRRNPMIGSLFTGIVPQFKVPAKGYYGPAKNGKFIAIDGSFVVLKIYGIGILPSGGIVEIQHPV
jgi:hypothetical protein